MDATFKKELPTMTEAGVRFLELPMRRSPHINDIKILSVIRKYLSEQGPFVLIHGHSSKAGGLARLLRVLRGPKVIYSPHGFATLSRDFRNEVRWGYGLIERGLSVFTDALIAVSPGEAKEAIRLGYSREKILIIPNGINLAMHFEEEKEEVRRKWGLTREHLIVGFVGRFVSDKAPFVLLEAFAQISSRHPMACLVMVGDGPLKSQMQEKVRQLAVEDRVLWPGFINGRLAMRAFDIFALPSDTESFGYVIVEAMAEGLPVVSTQVGVAELAIAEGENGYLVPIRDVKAFSQALDRLLSDSVKREQMGKISLTRVQQFTVEKMVDATLALYRELAGR
jgi:glycosyltransferase involved in cell wall biosynthesis